MHLHVAHLLETLSQEIVKNQLTSSTDSLLAVLLPPCRTELLRIGGHTYRPSLYMTECFKRCFMKDVPVFLITFSLHK